MADDLDTHLHADSFGSRAVPGLFAHERASGLLALGRLRRRGLVVASVLLVATAALWFGWPRAPQAVAAPVLAAPQPPTPPPPPVRFADGSIAQLHGAESGLFTEEMSAERVRLRLSGGARFDVVPNRERSFIVANAQVIVRVLGTAFSIDPDGMRTRVAVERGRVQVIWRNGATLLSAGEVALFPPENEPALVAAAAFDFRQPARASEPKRKSKLHKVRAKSAKAAAR